MSIRHAGRGVHAAVGSACALAILLAAWLGRAYFAPISESTDPEVDAPDRAHQRASDSDSPILFRSAELSFHYDRGDSGLALPVEPIGGGVGVADFDGDGSADLFFAQGTSLRRNGSNHHSSDTLLRNRGDAQFQDISAAAQLGPRGYGIGLVVADFDNDGFPDCYVTRYGANTLWHNQGDGTLRDVTPRANVGCTEWSVGAAFGDIDQDGDLDLYVTNYFRFDPERAPFARDPETGEPAYGVAASFDGIPDVMYRNDGAGQFADVTLAAGIVDQGRGMAVLAADFDGDSWIDFLVANDAQHNSLWRNQRNGQLEDVALRWGIALNAQGQPEANMGIAFGDTDGDGKQDVFISHLVSEHDTLWRGRKGQDAAVYFHDQTIRAGLGTGSLATTGWGTVFADFDRDGWLDLVVANGHVRSEPFQTYKLDNPPLLWRNTGDARFANTTSAAGEYFRALHQGRGLAAGDLDRDADVDLVIVHHAKPSVVLWNESNVDGAALAVRLIGESSNRDAVGADVRVHGQGRTWVGSAASGGSYASSNDNWLHFGLGNVKQLDRVEVSWPSGQIQEWTNIATGTAIILREGRASIMNDSLFRGLSPR